MSDNDLIRRGDALAVLMKAQIASCTCLTKTPDPDWHREGCRYRILREAEAMIEHVPTFAMTDATNARLRDPSVFGTPTAMKAADRIEALEREREAAVRQAVDYCDCHDFRDGGLELAVSEIIKVLEKKKVPLNLSE